LNHEEHEGHEETPLSITLFVRFVFFVVNASTQPGVN
jgi:hypothetical protein